MTQVEYFQMWAAACFIVAAIFKAQTLSKDQAELFSTLPLVTGLLCITMSIIYSKI